ncbi:MAG: 2-dehydro-3-deoxygalactonokinase [Succinivibrio sp.]|nr:2-dehydro-3-deoxygalactonokinase [Succinivibrio sp.]
MSTKNFVVMDWGSTNIRAFLYLDGRQAEEKKSAEGVTVVRGPDCEGAFDRLTSEWFSKYGPLPVVMSGMVGSINGWADAQYLDCPVNLAELPHHLTEVRHSKGYKIRIVPGLCVRDPDNYNVIRGEETQLAGAIKKQPSKVFLMPGTHCKWVLADGYKIESFRTAMTGEMHSIMMKYSLVGLGAGEQESSAEDFQKGLERGFYENNIVPRLFEIRGANILGAIRPSHVGEFLSGLLIGAEIASMQKIFKFTKEDGALGIIANPFLTERYVKGLKLAGLESFSLQGDEAFLGGMLPLAESLL